MILKRRKGQIIQNYFKCLPFAYSMFSYSANMVFHKSVFISFFQIPNLYINIQILNENLKSNLLTCLKIQCKCSANPSSVCLSCYLWQQFLAKGLRAIWLLLTIGEPHQYKRKRRMHNTNRIER